ncbi:hypothetical protein BD289DRAFT_463311 [Coniella lustricola]|uniref:Uncharacterized protein n=1 Tax=Coniella lustricola TaxID=2025994 RepID=A0A2T2ZWH7_9PEZI|nr:hypothetical protein BD289DRAFT_463311 [Coniella lustricola]
MTPRTSLAPAPSTPTPAPADFSRPDSFSAAAAAAAAADTMAALELEPTPSARRDSNLSTHSLRSPSRPGHSRDSSVSDKINQFNTLAAVQNSKLDRKTADAALKRAILGREAAEEESRRFKEEVLALRRQLEEGKDRERRVGERLETVMENYGRAKETHAHTQALWEKEIRRTRKETFKSQSSIVKLQEELKSARVSHKNTEETLRREKELSLEREQEAFQARYNLVGLQEQLDKSQSELEQALERIKTVEQERDAFKSLAKTEEDIARIAAEGKLPLPGPSMDDEDDEFASPRKATSSRAVSLSLVGIKSSAASEAEIEELTRLWHWEKQRANRANDHIEYLEAECRLRACSCMKKRSRSSMGLLSPKRQKRDEPVPLADLSDRMILSEKATIPSLHGIPAHAVSQPAKTNRMELREERRAAVFLPDSGTFETVPMDETLGSNSSSGDGGGGVDGDGGSHRNQVKMEADLTIQDKDMVMDDAPQYIKQPQVPVCFSRTPSLEPPSFAALGQESASCPSYMGHTVGQSPSKHHHQQQNPNALVRDTTPEIFVDAQPVVDVGSTSTSMLTVAKTRSDIKLGRPQLFPTNRAPLQSQDPNVGKTESAPSSPRRPQPRFKFSYSSRPHTAASFHYQTATTTTTVPLREETSAPNMAQKLLFMQQQQQQQQPQRDYLTPSRSASVCSSASTGSAGGSGRVADDVAPAWDVNNPALTPTMTREQALAQIRERRGRARSGGVATQRKPRVHGMERRDMSAPVRRKGRMES